MTLNQNKMQRCLKCGGELEITLGEIGRSYHYYKCKQCGEVFTKRKLEDEK